MKLLLWKMCFLALLSSLGCAALAQPVTQAEPPRRFTIAYVNDIHAQLEPHPELFWSGDNEEYVRGAGGLAVGNCSPVGILSAGGCPGLDVRRGES